MERICLKIYFPTSFIFFLCEIKNQQILIGCSYMKYMLPDMLGCRDELAAILSSKEWYTLISK